MVSVCRHRVSPPLSLEITHFYSMQGPKFVSDEEIERIKAKIEEDNRAIAALESKKYGEKGEILITVLTCWHAGMP